MYGQNTLSGSLFGLQPQPQQCSQRGLGEWNKGMRFSYHYSQSTGSGLELKPSTAAATAVSTAKTAESLPEPSKGCWTPAGSTAALGDSGCPQLHQPLPAAPGCAHMATLPPSPAGCAHEGQGPRRPAASIPVWTIHRRSQTRCSNTDDPVTCAMKPTLVSLYLSVPLASAGPEPWGPGTAALPVAHRECTYLSWGSPGGSARALPIARPGHGSLLSLQMSSSSSLGGSGSEGISRPKSPSRPFLSAVSLLSLALPGSAQERRQKQARGQSD